MVVVVDDVVVFDVVAAAILLLVETDDGLVRLRMVYGEIDEQSSASSLLLSLTWGLLNPARTAAIFGAARCIIVDVYLDDQSMPSSVQLFISWMDTIIVSYQGISII